MTTRLTSGKAILYTETHGEKNFRTRNTAVFDKRDLINSCDAGHHSRRRRETGGDPACRRISAAAIAGMTAPSPDWRQWDSFFTFIVKRLDQDVSGELRSSLGEAFLDSRYELTHTWSRLGGGQNPVPQLFVNAWRRLSPIMNKAVGGTTGIPAGSVAGSPDVLRNMARILQPTGGGDPIAYNLNIDGALRNLVGVGLPTGTRPAPSRRSGLRGLPFPLNVEQASLGIAFAAEANVKKLKQWVPEENELQAYLLEVRSLLTALGDRLNPNSPNGIRLFIGKSSLPAPGRRVVGASSSRKEKLWYPGFGQRRPGFNAGEPKPMAQSV
ncbi:MAG: hypothetical protein E6J74_02900 [Deltaproteobacteria bacterium]|nr:MAG: hypothetical protein E6J74_02900 [Deltaproteobacteria bacterium]